MSFRIIIYKVLKKLIELVQTEEDKRRERIGIESNEE